MPSQLLVRTPNGDNKPVPLPHGTSLYPLRTSLPAPGHRAELSGQRVYALPAALVFSGPGLFSGNPIEARAALAMIGDSSDVLSILLEGGHSVVAGRLAGAFRNIGRGRIADDIMKTMKSAGYDVREADPFDRPARFALSAREPSPYVTRMRLMWHGMREAIAPVFPAPPEAAVDADAYMQRVEGAYVTDAYHSLSIEGYRVTAELIERVRSGNRDPDNNDADREQRNALAARGYFEAFQSVKDSLRKVLNKENAGVIAGDDHGKWYRQLFAPSVEAGILKPADLAGYRNGPVYIRNSLHVPPSREAVRDMMPLLFELLADESDPGARVVLGHFLFVYIHPYMDGNGRMGRFLMNVMLAAGGYPWTVIPLQQLADYMRSLEAASAGQDIRPFAKFLGNLVRDNLAGKPLPDVPRR